MPEDSRDRRRPNRDNQERAPQKGEPGRAPTPPSRMNRGMFWWVSFALVLLMLFFWMQARSIQVQSLDTWSEFVTLYENGDIVENSIVVSDDAITAERLAPGGATQKIQFRIRPKATEFYLDELNTLTNGQFRDSGGVPLWMRILFSPLTLTIVLIALFWTIIMRGLRSVGSGGGMLGSFGKSRHRVLAKESTGVNFTDVAGVDEAKDELREIIEFLKNPKRFTRLGGRVPRGVLLVGEPGCGKTLLAKAIAGEADVPFFSISGSDFVEMFVGVGASRVRDLFKQAKESAPCIIFLDEIDAVGRRRGGGFSSGGHDEREQTLNAILVEMDGFDSSDQVIVIAATNRVDVLDPALLRPGRFDRQVIVPLPDLKGRLEILQVHARKIKLAPNVDLERLARGTPMFSGADLSAIINEAAIAATMQDKDFVEQDDLEEARDKVKYGRSRRSHVIEEEERIATAYHEAGHAVLQAHIPGADPLHKVTIIPRGQALGATFSIPEKDRHGVGLKWLRATMRVVCGGRIAELRKTGDASSGAAMDIQQLTAMARAAVLEWGMSERLGFVRYAPTDTRDTLIREREFSEDTARLIDDEIRRFADEAYRDAENIINDRWDAVARIAEALLKYETLSADEVQRLMRGEEITRRSVSDLLAAEARKGRESPPKPAPRRAPDDGADTGPGLLPSPA